MRLSIYHNVENKLDKLRNLKFDYCCLWQMGCFEGKFAFLRETFDEIIELECELIAQGKLKPEDMTV